MDAEEALEDEDEEEGSRAEATKQQQQQQQQQHQQQQQQQQQTSSRPAAADLQQQTCSSSSRKWRSGSGRAMRANHIVYRGLQPHAAADATVSEKEACGLLVEKDTGAYAELTRGLRAGTDKNHLEFLMSDMEV